MMILAYNKPIKYVHVIKLSCTSIFYYRISIGKGVDVNMNDDIRWKQRLSNFSKALVQLTEFIEKGDLNKFELQGLILIL
jgi:hypothetical protein